MPVSDSLRAASRIVGSEGPELAQDVATLTEARISDICESVLASPLLPGIEPSDRVVRPLVNARIGALHLRGAPQASTAEGSLGGLNLLTATDQGFAGESVFSRAVTRTLLYCHELVLEDPLALAADMYLSSVPSARRVARAFVETAVRTALEIDELVEAGVVICYWVPSDRPRHTEQLSRALMATQKGRSGDAWVDQAWDAFEALYVDGLDPSLQEVWARVRGGDRNPNLDLVRTSVSRGDGSRRCLSSTVMPKFRPSAVLVERRGLPGPCTR